MLDVSVKNLNRDQWICDAAYYKSVSRGFDPHYEVSNWLAAEQDYLAMLELNESKKNGAVKRMGLRQLAKLSPITQ